MIVVAGGSGTLGRLLVADLLAAGQQVGVIVRDAEGARSVLGPDVKIVAADIRSDRLDAAVAEADVVVSAVHGLLGGRRAGPEQVDDRGNARLAAAARASGASFVLVSLIGASPDSPSELFRAKYAAEQALRGSGSGWTIVRAGPFLETWVGLLRETAAGSGRPLVLGRGERRAPFVSAADVAAVVTRACLDPGLRGQVLEVGGEPLSLLELARAVQAADGRSQPPRHLPRAVLRLTAVAAGPFAPALARKSRAALVADTVDLGDGDPDLRARLGLPAATTVRDLLA